jgi:hypothetical protein
MKLIYTHPQSGHTRTNFPAPKITLAGLVTILMIFVLCSNGFSQPAPTRLDSIIVFHQHAVGDMDSIAALRTIFSESEMTSFGTKGRSIYYCVSPDRYYELTDLGYTSWCMGYDGDTVWFYRDRGPVTTGDPEDSAGVFNDLYLECSLYLLGGNTYGHVEIRNDTVINEKKHYQLAMFPRYGDSLYGFIDVESGLMDCYRNFVANHRTAEFLSDFRNVAGIKTAFHREYELEGTKRRVVQDILVREINEPVPDSIFSVPDLSSQSKKSRFVDGNDSAIVKFEMKKNWVIVPARINGKNKCNFLLDTGASGCLITHKLAKKLGVETMGEATTDGIAGDVVYRFAEIDSVEMGGLVWYPGRIQVIYGNEETGDIFRSIDGILGYDFFMDFPMRVDLDRRDIVLFDTTLANPAKPGTPVTIDLSHLVARKDMSLDGRPIRMLIDLGANFEIFLYSNYRWFYKLADDLRFNPPDAQAFGVGGHRPIKAGRADSLKFDGIYIDRPEVYIAPRPEGFKEVGGVEGLLGAEILTRYNLFIDYPDSKIYFDERQGKK